jgi:O-antigen ligase
LSDRLFNSISSFILFIGITFSFLFKGLASSSFFALSLLSLIFIFFNNIKIKIHYLTLIIFSGIFLSNLFNNIFYNNIFLKSYDFSLRFLLAFLIIIYFSNIKIDLNKIFYYSFSFLVLFCSFYFFFLSDSESIFGTRSHTNFVDPNTLGIYIGAFCIFIFCSIRTLNFFNIFTLILGLVLIIFSFTRTSWIAMIISLPIIFFILKSFDKFSTSKLYFFIFFIVIFSLFLLFNSDRFISTFIEIQSRLAGNTEGTSIGDRISLAVLAISILDFYSYFFGVNSVTVNSFDVLPIINQLNFQIDVYKIYRCCGFHNQYITILYYYGLIGLTFFILFLISPFIIFLFNRNRNLIPYLCTFIYLIICSLGLDIINLKYTQSIFLFLFIGFYSLYLRDKQLL